MFIFICFVLLNKRYLIDAFSVYILSYIPCTSITKFRQFRVIIFFFIQSSDLFINYTLKKILQNCILSFINLGYYDCIFRIMIELTRK